MKYYIYSYLYEGVTTTKEVNKMRDSKEPTDILELTSIKNDAEGIDYLNKFYHAELSSNGYIPFAIEYELYKEVNGSYEIVDGLYIENVI